MLQVARKKTCCKVLGPGIRSVIWFHGCPRRCPGCIADTMNVATPNTMTDYETLSPSQLADWVLKNDGIENGTIEGITLSGGDPLFQTANDLAEFLSLVKHNSELSVMCYTGYRYEELLNDSEKRKVLQYIDVLVDGEYRQDLDNGQRWRGSENQRFHFLTERYRIESDDWYATNERQIEIELTINGKVLISGVPSKDFIANLTAKMETLGVDVDFT
ncbi:MAG: radical SAM protein [Planctomycetaceae bacterium]|jgi:anaerobic ribonucleoside-triphosphate reductase activating protein|nr:radical SAM protein [Planctomycetaceae bacterium]